MVAGLRVVGAQPVHQDQDLAEGRALHLEVGLHAPGTSVPGVEPGKGAEEIGDGGRSPGGDLRGVEDDHVASRSRQLAAEPGGADHDGGQLVGGRGVLGGSDPRPQEGGESGHPGVEQEASKRSFHDISTGLENP